MTNVPKLRSFRNYIETIKHDYTRNMQ